MELDESARTLAFKILNIIFIVITILANAEYLFRYFWAPKVIYRAGHFGKITLALGSLFLAFFSYMIWAILSFGNAPDMTCGTLVIAHLYQRLFFPFVFGLIIVSTGLNLYLNQRQMFNFNEKLMSFVMAVFPWLLGLLVICPLALAGIEWDHGCFHETSWDRVRALYVIALLLPATAALLFGIFLNVVTSTSTQQTLFTMPYTSTEIVSQADTTVSTTPPNTNLAMVNFDTTQPVISAQMEPQPGFQGTTHRSFESGQLHQNRNIPQHHQEYPQQYPQPYGEQYHQGNAQQYPHQQFSYYNPPLYAQQYPPQHPQVTPMYTPCLPQTTAPAAPTPLTILTLKQFTMEKRGLLWASLIFFFSVFPYACFSLAYDLNDDPDVRFNIDQSMIIIIRDICLWVTYLYPVLVPIAWQSQVQM